MKTDPSVKRIVLTQHMFGLGGIDRVGCLLANGFAQAGFDVDLLVFCRNGPAEATLAPLLDKRVCVTYLGERSASRFFDLVRLTPKWINWLKRRQPDLAMSTANNMNWVTAAGVKFSGVPGLKLILKTTNPIVRARDKGVYNAVRLYWYRKVFEYADKVLALSEAETRLLRQQFPSAAGHIASVINPYVTPEMLDPAPTTITGDGRKIVLGVGRFEPQKRMELLIHAFAEMNDPDARLVILGEGPERARCAEIVRELKIEDRTHMPGFVSDVAAWLKAANIFVLTSVYEGLPAVVLEALACNCPVLSTDCFPAARELLANADHCALIDDPAPASLAALMRDHLKHERPTSLRAIAETYTVANGVQSHLDHTRSVLAQAH